MKTKILVTGGTGYIGSHTTVELQNAGYDVIIIDNLSNSNIGVLDGIEAITGVRPTFVEGDCTDMATMRRLFDENPASRVSSTSQHPRQLESQCTSHCSTTATTSTR